MPPGGLAMIQHPHCERQFCFHCCSTGWNLGASAALNPKRLDFGWLLTYSVAGGKANECNEGQHEEVQTMISHHPHTPWSVGMVPYHDSLLSLDREALNPKP